VLVVDHDLGPDDVLTAALGKAMPTAPMTYAVAS
jgi:hypothetical protein